MLRKFPFVIPMLQKAISSNNMLLETEAWKNGAYAHIQTIGLSNYHSGAKVAFVGVARAELQLFLKTITLTTNSYFYSVTLDIDIPIDYQVIVKLASPTAGNLYTANVFGYLMVETEL